MLKMTIDNEEVVSDKDITINEEMLSASSTILNNVYPKEWEEDKDYTSKFYYPQDYSKALIQRSYVTQEAEAGTTIQVNGSVTLTDVDTTKNSRVLRLLGQTSQSGTPTPSSPIPVNVVSGDNDIKTEGKNLITFDNIGTSNLLGVDKTYNGSEFTLNGTTTGSGQFQRKTYITTLSAGTYKITYRLKSGTIIGIGSGKDVAIYIQNTGGTNLTTSTLATLNVRGSITGDLVLSDTTPLYFYGYCNSSGIQFSNVVITAQIEIGSSSSTYEPYIGNTYNIDLPEGMELCKIGNYQDYIYKDSGKWYLHKEIGKVVLNGSEANWNVVASSNLYRAEKVFNILPYTDTSRHIGRFICSHFYPNTNNEIGAIFQYQSTLLFYVSSGITTVEQWKIWLGNNNTTLYYVLETPTDTEITYTELLNQLNALSSQ